MFLGGLHNEECSFYNPIKKNKVAFSKQAQRVSSSKEKALKGDCRLFSRLFISCQTRQCDLQEFFIHENQSSPASLNDGGRLPTCHKSQLTDILQAQVDMPERAPEGEVIIVDCSVMVNTTPDSPAGTRTRSGRRIIPPIRLDLQNTTVVKTVCSRTCARNLCHIVRLNSSSKKGDVVI